MSVNTIIKPREELSNKKKLAAGIIEDVLLKLLKEGISIDTKQKNKINNALLKELIRIPRII